jgi:membrane-bound serine protease (ClpP class)
MPRLVRALLIVAFLLPMGVASGQEGSGSIDVVVVGGPMDHRTVEFVTAAIADSRADLVILQLDVEAVLDGDLDGLVAAIKASPVPVAAWVGPSPATLQGGAVDLFAAAAVRGAAPGVSIGRARPAVAGGDPGEAAGDWPAGYATELVRVTAPDLLVDLVAPSIGQFVVGLDDRVVTAGGASITLDTARTEVVDGETRVVPAVPVRFISEGPIDRVLHAAVRPEAAFFFLMIGLALIAFEFWAAGPGLAAATGAGCLLLAGYGMAVMPTWWPAPVMVVAGVLLYLADLQRNDLRWLSLLGTGLLLFAGLRFVDGAPHLTAVWWVVVLVVTGTGLFFGFALTTVVRARFSTTTIGRDRLIGRGGVALVAVAPEGEVEIDGARWRARSTRRSGIGPGDAVVVTRIDGVVLEVDPAP